MIVGGTAATGSSKMAHKTYQIMVQNVQLTDFVPKMAWVVRAAPPARFYKTLGQTHVNGWSCVITSQNEGSTSYIFPSRLRGITIESSLI